KIYIRLFGILQEVHMKKSITFILVLFFTSAFVGCGKNDTHRINITVPAGSSEDFIYSDKEL
ncbi:hypothetical protein L0N00_14670, partial [Eggerthella lenta]|nr:hypothetical protein [Eggerthella lenta]